MSGPSRLMDRPSKETAFADQSFNRGFSGAYGGGRSVHRPGGRQEATQTIGDHLGRAIGQAQQRTHASSQNREREQVPGVPPYQGNTRRSLPREHSIRLVRFSFSFSVFSFPPLPPFPPSRFFRGSRVRFPRCPRCPAALSRGTPLEDQPPSGSSVAACFPSAGEREAGVRTEFWGINKGSPRKSLPSEAGTSWLGRTSLRSLREAPLSHARLTYPLVDRVAYVVFQCKYHAKYKTARSRALSNFFFRPPCPLLSPDDPRNRVS